MLLNLGSRSQKTTRLATRMATESKPECPCGLKHYWVDCWLINTQHPRRPKTYINAIGQKKLNAALAADPDLRDRINKALDKWRAKRQDDGGSIVMDDGNPPIRPAAHAVSCISQDLECVALDNKKTTQDVDIATTSKEDVKTKMFADDGLKPEYDLYTAVSLEEGIDELSNRWILDPGSNTHVVNTEEWVGWTRNYEATVRLWWWGLGKSAPLARCAVRPWGTLPSVSHKETPEFRRLRLPGHT